jgi:S-adenosylmethionine uptake transporter
MIIVRPGSQGFNAYSLWALGAVFFIVLRDLSTRRLSRDVPALGVVFVSTLAVAAVAGVLALATEMRAVSWVHLARLATSAMFLLVGTQFAVKTMRIGEIGFVQPFRYTLLVWAVLLGIFMFDEWPDAWTLAGGAIVVATGLFTFYRERGLRRAGGGTQPAGT